MFLQFEAAVKKRLQDSDVRIIITGAGGWLGLATLEMLANALGADFERRVVPIASRSREVSLRCGVACKLIDFKDAEKLAVQPTIIAHYAFLTREKVSENTLDAYIRQNRAITNATIALAQRIQVSGIFSTSSGAVYNKDKTLANDISLNPYGVLKLEEETALKCLAKSNKVSLSICRLFNLSGPYIHKSFALNSILLDILSDRDVVLKAAHPVVRDYMHVRDLISLGFTMILDRTNNKINTYDSGIGVPIEINLLAEKAIALLKKKSLKVVRPNFAGTSDFYAGDVTMIKSLAEKYAIAMTDLDQQIIDTANFLTTS